MSIYYLIHLYSLKYSIIRDLFLFTTKLCEIYNNNTNNLLKSAITPYINVKYKNLNLYNRENIKSFYLNLTT